MAPLHVTALLLAGASSCGALVSPPRSPLAASAASASTRHRLRRPLWRDGAPPAAHQSPLDEEASSADRWPVLQGEACQERWEGCVTAVILAALAASTGAQAAQAAPNSGSELPSSTSSVVASTRDTSKYGNPFYRGLINTLPFGVSAAYAADTPVGADEQSTAQKDMQVQYDGPGDSSSTTVAKERDLYVEFDRSGDAAPSEPRRETIILGAYNDASLGKTSSKPLSAPDPRVVIEEDGQQNRIARRAPEPELGVLLEKGPPRRRSVRPTPELTVRLEPTAPQRVEAPPDNAANDPVAEPEMDAAKASPEKSASYPVELKGEQTASEPGVSSSRAAAAQVAKEKTIKSLADALAGAVTTAEIFSLGFGAGIVVLLTRKRRKEMGVSNTSGARGVGNDEDELVSRRPYLDSLSVVSSAGRGQRSYLDELSESESDEQS
ncbi:hypothetical protein ACHAXT_008644 [Thalassiosira profunda]